MDYDQMYADLEMRDDQIRAFKSAMDKFQQERVSKPNGEMMGSVEDERTRQLESILSEVQFQKYQKWQADN
ncbi:MAG TPA: hypothetical protein VFD35_00675 [Pricia sp.]|nr:hypothetical protein [Pricia sp.]